MPVSWLSRLWSEWTKYAYDQQNDSHLLPHITCWAVFDVIVTMHLPVSAIPQILLLPQFRNQFLKSLCSFCMLGLLYCTADDWAPKVFCNWQDASVWDLIMFSSYDVEPIWIWDSNSPFWIRTVPIIINNKLRKTDDIIPPFSTNH